MGILSGLSDMGIGNVEQEGLYKKDAQKTPVKKEPEVKKTSPVNEEDFIFEKSFTCPCCDKAFKEMTVKTGKARLVKVDRDLRPCFSGIDTLKYDVVSCPSCGFTTTNKYFAPLASAQIKLIKEKITPNFKKFARGKIVSYDEALERYKLALANCIVKRGKDSEKAYTCLRMAWVVRGKAENLNRADENYEQLLKEHKEDEDELLHNALEGFVSAVKTEHFPIAGMDEMTLDYLLAALFYKEGDLENCARLISKILTSKTANSRIKERAREIKDEILEQRKKN